MTDHDRKPTAEQPAVQQPGVSADTGTDRSQSTWRSTGIPSHLGRARTSTVILSLLFLAIGTLYLQIRPDDPARPRTAETGVEQEAPETTPPAETTVPEETDPETTEPPTAPTSTPARTPTDTPDGTTTAPDTSPDEDIPTTAEPEEQTETGTDTGTGTAPG